MSVPVATLPASSTDADLVRAYRSGDERGATELVGRHALAISRFLSAAGAESGDLDDLVQDTFFPGVPGLGRVAR